VRERLGQAATSMKKRYDAKTKKEFDFVVGQSVWYFYPRRYSKLSLKWQSLYVGPFTVVKLIDTYIRAAFVCSQGEKKEWQFTASKKCPVCNEKVLRQHNRAMHYERTSKARARALNKRLERKRSDHVVSALSSSTLDIIITDFRAASRRTNANPEEIVRRHSEGLSESIIAAVTMSIDACLKKFGGTAEVAELDSTEEDNGPRVRRFSGAVIVEELPDIKDVVVDVLGEVEAEESINFSWSSSDEVGLGSPTKRISIAEQLIELAEESMPDGSPGNDGDMASSNPPPFNHVTPELNYVGQSFNSVPPPVNPLDNVAPPFNHVTPQFKYGNQPVGCNSKHSGQPKNRLVAPPPPMSRLVSPAEYANYAKRMQCYRHTN
jgi:hypothetical protein